ncbi:hypothetical protein LINGRAHAP2_LOCUS8740, partial [Linum grandiflorum]
MFLSRRNPATGFTSSFFGEQKLWFPSKRRSDDASWKSSSSSVMFLSPSSMWWTIAFCFRRDGRLPNWILLNKSLHIISFTKLIKILPQLTTGSKFIVRNHVSSVLPQENCSVWLQEEGQEHL